MASVKDYKSTWMIILIILKNHQLSNKKLMQFLNVTSLLIIRNGEEKPSK